jgi:hypothetical protein
VSINNSVSSELPSSFQDQIKKKKLEPDWAVNTTEAAQVEEIVAQEKQI